MMRPENASPGNRSVRKCRVSEDTVRSGAAAHGAARPRETSHNAAGKLRNS